MSAMRTACFNPKYFKVRLCCNRLSFGYIAKIRKNISCSKHYSKYFSGKTHFALKFLDKVHARKIAHFTLFVQLSTRPFFTFAVAYLRKNWKPPRPPPPPSEARGVLCAFEKKIKKNGEYIYTIIAANKKKQPVKPILRTDYLITYLQL
jgi:hypothetical protein